MSPEQRYKKGEISRQRVYQLRHEADGLCRLCSAKAVVGRLCLPHAVAKRESQKRKTSATRQRKSRPLERVFHPPDGL